MPARTRAEACLSDFAIDSLLAGDLAGEEARRGRDHAATCEVCAERIARTTRERDAFMDEAPPLELGERRRALDVPVLAAPARRLPRARLGAASAIVALAAAVLLFVGLRRGEDPAGERTKGSRGRLGIIVKHGESTRTSAPEDAVSAGDRLRFRYTSSESTHLAIMGVDGARRATVYVPQAPHDVTTIRAERVEAGVDVALTTTIELDDAPGTETFYALFCDSPVLLEPIRLALEARRGEPPSTSCSVDRVVLRKEPHR